MSERADSIVATKVKRRLITAMVKRAIFGFS